MHENFTGIRIVKAFSMEENETERFKDMNKSYFKSLIKALRAELLMTPLMEAVALIIGCGFLIICLAKNIMFDQIVAIGIAAVFA